MKKVKIPQKSGKAPVYEKKTVATRIVDMKEYINNCHEEWLSAQNERNTFIANQVKWYKKRYGIRPKKTFPWPGASNLHLPLQDKVVRKTKPIFVDVIMKPLPMLHMQPVGGEDYELAEKASLYFDWKMRNRTKIFPTVVLAADKTLSKGFSIAKVIYRREYEPVSYVIYRDELFEHMKDTMIPPPQTQQGVAIDPQRQALERQKFNPLAPENAEAFVKILTDTYAFDTDDPNDQEKISNIIIALRNGAEAVEFTVDEKSFDAPDVIILDPQRITVPTNSQTILDFEECRWIDHTYDVTPQQLYVDGLSGKFKMTAVKEILRINGIDDISDISNPKKYQPVKKSKDSEDEQMKSLRDQRTGTSSVIENSITLHERYCWFDSDGDGREERHVLNYSEDYMDEELRFIRYPYKMKKWPFVKIPCEICEENHYSPRGQVEILNPIATALNVQHNQKINRQTLLTACMFWYVPGKVNPDNINFIPGRGIPVAPPGNQNFGMVNTVDNTSFSFEREEQMLKAWAEEYMGSTDYGLASAVNPMGTSQARTKYELESIQSSAQRVVSLDVAIWKAAWAEIFDRYYQLEMEFGEDEDWIVIDELGKPQELTKSEVSEHYNIVPAGELNLLDPVIQMAQSYQRYTELKMNPMVKQDALLIDWVGSQDPRLIKRLLRTPEEMKQIEIMMMLAAQNQQLAEKGGKPNAGNSGNNTGRGANK